jgi:hypothetical protein
MAKAAAVQYSAGAVIEHVHPLVRTEKWLERVLKEVSRRPASFSYHRQRGDRGDRAAAAEVPALHVLRPSEVFESYLGAPQTPVVAGQHRDADTRRIVAQFPPCPR